MLHRRQQHTMALSEPGICLFTGPMMGGKTQNLIDVIMSTPESESFVLGYTGGETRVCGMIYSRCGTSVNAQLVPTLEMDMLQEIADDPKIKSVFIDEGQFFENIAKAADFLAQMGKAVYIAALNGTYECKPWASMIDLLPLCTKIIMHTARCSKCQAPAIFSKRLTQSTELIEVGSHYQPRCRAHFLD